MVHNQGTWQALFSLLWKQSACGSILTVQGRRKHPPLTASTAISQTQAARVDGAHCGAGAYTASTAPQSLSAARTNPEAAPCANGSCCLPCCPLGDMLAGDGPRVGYQQRFHLTAEH